MSFFKRKKAPLHIQGLLAFAGTALCVGLVLHCMKHFIETNEAWLLVGALVALAAAVYFGTLASLLIHRHILLQQFHLQFGSRITSDWPFRSEFSADNVQYTIVCYDPRNIVVSEESQSSGELLVIRVQSGHVTAQRHTIELSQHTHTVTPEKMGELGHESRSGLSTTKAVRHLHDIVQLAPTS